MATALENLTDAVIASTLASEALLGKLATVNAAVTTLSAQVAELQTQVSAGDPAVQAQVDALNAQTAKVTAA